MSDYQQFAQRIVAGLEIQPGELIQVRDHCDHPGIVHELLLAIDRAGATPLLDHQSPAYLNRWLAEATPEAIRQSSPHRLRWIEQVDRVVVLGGGVPDFSLAAAETLAAWHELNDKTTQIEEDRLLPVLVVAVPTQQMADRLGVSLDELEAHLMPAHLLNVDASRRLIQEALAKVDGKQLAIRSGNGHILHFDQGGRHWHGDDGVIDAQDRLHKTIVSNLPAGSIYTTVVEDATHGSLYLPNVALPGGARVNEVVFHFEAGRIHQIEAENGTDQPGAAQIAAWLDSHSGEPRRISHIGVGLNPHLTKPIGWTIVDEHINGALFLALGENRYMGGQNESSLNHDFALRDATLKVMG